MANLFDVLTALPDAVWSGDDIKWKRDDIVSAYPLDDYSVQYLFREPFSDATATAAAVEENATYVFTLPTMVTGRWSWTLEITQTSDSRIITVDRGALIVKPQPSSADDLSHAAIMLNAIETEIKARVSGDGSANTGYSINGRSLTRMDMEVLEAMRKRYVAEVNAEERRAAGSSQFARRTARFS